MFTDIEGNNWPRVYFVTFWIMVVLIMLNCLLSILIEVYGTVTENIDVTFEKRELAFELMNRYRGKEEDLKRDIFKLVSVL